MARELWKDSCALRGLQLARSDSSPAFDDFGKTSLGPSGAAEAEAITAHTEAIAAHLCCSVRVEFESPGHQGASGIGLC